MAGGEPGPAAASGRRRVAVVGGGITGLSAALHLVDLAREHGLDVEVAVLEAGGDFGGKVRTDRPGPFVIEQGPDSLLARKPWGVDLCRRLGVADLLTGPGPHGGRSYLVSRGRLEPMPAGLILGMPASPLALLTTRLVPLSGRLRAALEPWVPRGGGEDESLHQFLCRRLGRSTAEAVAEPLLEAVHAGDARRLSARATYPQLVTLEERYGSLARGLQAQRAQRAQDSEAARHAQFITLRTGLGTLPERAVEALRRDSRVRLLAGCPVTALEPLSGGRWRVVTAGGQQEQFHAVVVTVPAYAAARLVAPWAPAAVEALEAIPYASTAAVALAFPRDAVAHPLDGSGFLVPRAEVRVITGCTWLSSKWPHTSPPDTVLMRCFVGRAGSEEMLSLPDDALIDAVDRDLRRYMDIAGAPVLARVYRWPRAMPQYEVGHHGRVRAAEEALAGFPTLALAGAGLHGIGVPDCIRQGGEAARRVLGLSAGSAGPGGRPATPGPAGAPATARPTGPRSR
ncbi:MAG: protoporphyrinogen oxidase [Bacillota bacterium]|nr:protoporphyrinogen oxidase [Bacillota bacterium]REJ37652.1 MAG: protoporphyrinogen oxidase [Bacillota bacterium]